MYVFGPARGYFSITLSCASNQHVITGAEKRQLARAPDPRRESWASRLPSAAQSGRAGCGGRLAEHATRELPAARPCQHKFYPANGRAPPRVDDKIEAFGPAPVGVGGGGGDAHYRHQLGRVGRVRSGRAPSKSKCASAGGGRPSRKSPVEAPHRKPRLWQRPIYIHSMQLLSYLQHI